MKHFCEMLLLPANSGFRVGGSEVQREGPNGYMDEKKHRVGGRITALDLQCLCVLCIVSCPIQVSMLVSVVKVVGHKQHLSLHPTMPPPPPSRPPPPPVPLFPFVLFPFAHLAHISLNAFYRFDL